MTPVTRVIIIYIKKYDHGSFQREHNRIKNLTGCVPFETKPIGVDAPENSFIVKSSRLWNNLPDKLCLISNVDCFKSALKNMYLEGYKEAC
jgi:hypothetical protein